MTDDADLRARHLDMLQHLISRLSQNSFTVRGWSITLVTATLALLAAQRLDHTIALFALVPAWVFWGLDASYLRTERLFRTLFEAAAARLNDPDARPDVKPFDMNTARFKQVTPSWFRLLVSPSVAAIPMLLTVATIAYSVVGIR